MTAATGRVHYVVRTWIPEDEVAAWDAWHTGTHIPEVVAQPTVRRARKYRVEHDTTPAAWPAQFVTIYEFDSLAAYESYRTSAAAARLRADYDARYGASGRIARQVLVEVAAIVKEATSDG